MRCLAAALVVLLALPARAEPIPGCPEPPATDIPREVKAGTPAPADGLFLSLPRAQAMVCAGEGVVRQRDAAQRDLATCRASQGGGGGASYGTVVVVALASLLAGAIGGGYLVIKAVSK